MALEHAYPYEGDAPRAAVRRALDALEDSDVSKSSPVSGGASELAVTTGEHDGERVVIVREEGHEGEWTKTSERALKAAVKSVPVIDQQVYTEGGYRA